MANIKIAPVNVAFCFDENMGMLAGVSIMSLIYHARRPVDIYCVVPSDFSTAMRGELTRMVHEFNPMHQITFLNANHDFDASVTKQYTTGIYYRFMLVKLLPAHIDRIIYLDADTTVCGDLGELFDGDMGKNLIAGVRDGGQNRPWPSNPNGYINSGVLVMNIREIRRTKIYDVWRQLSMSDEFSYPDQDILNKTCDGRIQYVGPAYNYMCGDGTRLDRAGEMGIYTRDELASAHKNPMIIHYILRQPWRGRENAMGHIWWRYAAMTPFYHAFRAKLDQRPNTTRQWILIFNMIPLCLIITRDRRREYRLFGIIPLVKIKTI